LNNLLDLSNVENGLYLSNVGKPEKLSLTTGDNPITTGYIEINNEKAYRYHFIVKEPKNQPIFFNVLYYDKDKQFVDSKLTIFNDNPYVTRSVFVIKDLLTVPSNSVAYIRFSMSSYEGFESAQVYELSDKTLKQLDEFSKQMFLLHDNILETLQKYLNTHTDASIEEQFPLILATKSIETIENKVDTLSDFTVDSVKLDEIKQATTRIIENINKAPDKIEPSTGEEIKNDCQAILNIIDDEFEQDLTSPENIQQMLNDLLELKAEVSNVSIRNNELISNFNEFSRKQTLGLADQQNELKRVKAELTDTLEQQNFTVSTKLEDHKNRLELLESDKKIRITRDAARDRQVDRLEDYVDGLGSKVANLDRTVSEHLSDTVTRLDHAINDSNSGVIRRMNDVEDIVTSAFLEEE